MNKADLVSRVADEAGVNRTTAEKALGGALDAIGAALAAGEKVALAGFGTFSVTQREARKGRNPNTGEKLRIPAKRAVKFKPGSKLANRVK
ncbi:MAG: HU family DNA-binding protein [Thermodesulfobacteriota bacterium]